MLQFLTIALGDVLHRKMDCERRSTGVKTVQICLLLCLLPATISGECLLQDCIDAYHEDVAAEPSTVCESITRAKECISDCSLSFEKQLSEATDNTCSEEMPNPCDSVLPFFNDNLEILDSPVISYRNYNSVCPQDSRQDTRHCNMFTYSHIRQFSHSTIQTCSVSEPSTLIEQDDLAIAITAGSEEQSTGYNLETVTLFIYPDLCTENQLLLYDVSALNELPLDVTNAFNPNTKSSSVEVNVNSDRTVASILLPWLSMAIVVYRYANTLGVVIEMPTEMAELDKGLCRRGCHEGSLINAAQHINDYCLSDRESAMLSCKIFSDLDYRTACQFDVLNSQEYDVVSVISAVATTCKLLPDFDNNLDILDSPVINSKNPDSVCSRDTWQNKRLCTMFTYSHIRQFGRSTIQTCSASAQSTLIELDQLAIAVTADSDEQSTGYRLKTIALLIYPVPCTANQLLLYAASAGDELPLGVRNRLNSNTKSNSVEVYVNANRTTASILLPWLGTTIVIYRHANNLGIVIEMPTAMAELDKGLCRLGCSEGSLIDAAEHINGYCRSNQESAMLGCKSLSNLYYRTACQFDVLNSEKYDAASVISAIVTACKLLYQNDDVSGPIDQSPTVDPTYISTVPETSGSSAFAGPSSIAHEPKFSETPLGNACSCCTLPLLSLLVALGLTFALLLQ